MQSGTLMEARRPDATSFLNDERFYPRQVDENPPLDLATRRNRVWFIASALVMHCLTHILLDAWLFGSTSNRPRFDVEFR
jgi:hypothetical protein